MRTDIDETRLSQTAHLLCVEGPMRRFDIQCDAGSGAQMHEKLPSRFRRQRA